MEKAHSPGYFRYKLGDYEITSIYDGLIPGDASLYVGMEVDEIEKIWADNFSDTFVKDGKIFTTASVNTFLIDTEKELILIDAGAGSLAPSAGFTAKNINLSGYNVEDITVVLMTHLHPDHVFGLTIDGKMIFPNATVYINKADYNIWINILPNLKDLLQPYLKKNQCKLFNSGDKLVEGITGIPLPGHTVGHTGYEASSNGEKILFWGDIIHDPDVQFYNMDVEIVLVDRNEERIKLELKTAKDTVEKAVIEKTLIGGVHMPFPGIGHVVKNETGSGYRWIPVRYKE